MTIVPFYDRTQLILCARDRYVTYTNKHAERATYDLDTVFDVPRPDLRKRLAYTKDAFSRLLSRPSSAPPAPSGPAAAADAAHAGRANPTPSTATAVAAGMR